MKAHHVRGGAGLDLYVEETGTPSGRPVLFIHGLSQCRLAWRKQFHSDLASELRLITMDIRGHGWSEKPHDAYGDSLLWADDLHAVITALDLQAPILSGWSYGGIVIADYVQAYGDDGIGKCSSSARSRGLASRSCPSSGRSSSPASQASSRATPAKVRRRSRPFCSSARTNRRRGRGPVWRARLQHDRTTIRAQRLIQPDAELR